MDFHFVDFLCLRIVVDFVRRKTGLWLFCPWSTELGLQRSKHSFRSNLRIRTPGFDLQILKTRSASNNRRGSNIPKGMTFLSRLEQVLSLKLGLFFGSRETM